MRKNKIAKWYVEEWHVDKNASDKDKIFAETKLIKGLVGKLLFGKGHTYKISFTAGEKSFNRGKTYCQKLPYYSLGNTQSSFRKFGKNRIILLNMDRESFEKLYEENAKEFECSYENTNYYKRG